MNKTIEVDAEVYNELAEFKQKYINEFNTWQEHQRLMKEMRDEIAADAAVNIEKDQNNVEP